MGRKRHAVDSAAARLLSEIEEGMDDPDALAGRLRSASSLGDDIDGQDDDEDAMIDGVEDGAGTGLKSKGGRRVFGRMPAGGGEEWRDEGDEAEEGEWERGGEKKRAKTGVLGASLLSQVRGKDSGENRDGGEGESVEERRGRIQALREASREVEAMMDGASGLSLGSRARGGAAVVKATANKSDELDAVLAFSGKSRGADLKGQTARGSDAVTGEVRGGKSASVVQLRGVSRNETSNAVSANGYREGADDGEGGGEGEGEEGDEEGMIPDCVTANHTNHADTVDDSLWRNDEAGDERGRGEEEEGEEEGEEDERRRQARLIQMAFAGDDVAAEFEEEKERAMEEEGEEVEEAASLPGWGQWTEVQKRKGEPAWMVKEREEAKRKREAQKGRRSDAKMKNVIISEKKDKKVSVLRWELVQMP